MKQQKMHLLENRNSNGTASWGSYWEKGSVSDKAAFLCKNEKGESIQIQSHITAYWPDGSVKWAAHAGDSKKLGNTIEITALEVTDEHNDKTISKNDSIIVEQKEDGMFINAGTTSITISPEKDVLFKSFYAEDRLVAKEGKLILLLEERNLDGDVLVTRTVPYNGIIKETKVIENGPVRCVIQYKGTHQCRKSGVEKIPFSLFMEITKDSADINFTHTFFYDGDEKKDFLKGIGVTFDVPVEGENVNRHVKFATDHGTFHESLAMLLSWRPRVPMETYEAQIRGERLTLDPEKDAAALETALQIPIWGEYALVQDSASHFSIRKRISNPDCCFLDGLHGNKAKGAMAFGGTNGSFTIVKKDFWQKCPATLQVKALDKEIAQAAVWFYSPEAEAYDFRHYATEGYSQSYYEGFDEVGATPFGIANTSSFSITAGKNVIPSDDELAAFLDSVQKPAVYVADPSYYHELKAFGYWSLPKKETEAEKWLEEQMDQLIEFYKKEIDVRNWYGLFNYGDFMHTYDKTRHSWRYDMGGYAWQNTELVPTYWLWYSFLRSGREDIFTLAEAMSRHCSEVDTYHFGPLQGIGSRHNVRHWGCSCKEARIAMAGHHRFYYYLTGDYRLADLFDEIKDGDFATLNIDPLRFFFDKDKMVYPTHARSGPDWSSFCSNWMTRWERYNDKTYADYIKVGIEDLKKMPLQLISGSDFEYDPANKHLRYIGERATGGTHLQICMGAEQVWIELADLLEDEEWVKMLADFGHFYLLSHEEQLKLSNGLINDRTFTYPFMAGGIIAYGAAYYKDHELGRQLWNEMKGCLEREVGDSCFCSKDINNAGNQEVLHEVAGISTNVASQWCLNVICALEFIREDLW